MTIDFKAQRKRLASLDWGTWLTSSAFAGLPCRQRHRLYPHIGPLWPSVGYGNGQLRELEETIRRAKPEVVLVVTKGRMSACSSTHVCAPGSPPGLG